MKAPKSQLTSEQSSTKKTGTYKNDILHPKTKKKPQQERRRGTFLIQSNPMSTGWATHKLETNYITEFFPEE